MDFNSLLVDFMFCLSIKCCFIIHVEFVDGEFVLVFDDAEEVEQGEIENTFCLSGLHHMPSCEWVKRCIAHVSLLYPRSKKMRSTWTRKNGDVASSKVTREIRFRAFAR